MQQEQQQIQSEAVAPQNLPFLMPGERVGQGTWLCRGLEGRQMGGQQVPVFSCALPHMKAGALVMVYFSARGKLKCLTSGCEDRQKERLLSSEPECLKHLHI